MRLYKFNYHANYQNHAGETWATSAYEVERAICSQCPEATGICVWVV